MKCICVYLWISRFIQTSKEEILVEELTFSPNFQGILSFSVCFLVQISASQDRDEDVTLEHTVNNMKRLQHTSGQLEWL